MSVRSFHSVFMATAVAGAALGCYLVSLRVASERAALQEVESQIFAAQSDIRLLQTEIGTRARLSQLERWNARALALSAPSAGQILADKFQLARLVAPQRKLDIEAPVVLASAPAPQPAPQLGTDSDSDPAPVATLLHDASYQVPDRKPVSALRETPPKPAASKAVKPATSDEVASAAKPTVSKKPAAAQKSASTPPAAAKKPVRTASVDPLAPLPAGQSTTEASRTNR